MKALKSLVVFSVMAGTSLMGCGGVTDAEAEDTLNTTEEALCPAPAPYTSNCQLIGPVECAVPGGGTFSYLCQMQPYGCKLYNSTSCTWSSYTDANCATFMSNYCQ